MSGVLRLFVFEQGKVKSYGDSYEAIATITVVDGEPHIEGLLGINGFTRSDMEAIRTYLVSKGYTHCTTSKFIDGNRKSSVFELTI